jgi:hypothetical protein
VDFLNHREGDMVSLSGISIFSFTVYSNGTVETGRGCVSLKKKKSKGKTVKVTVNNSK